MDTMKKLFLTLLLSVPYLLLPPASFAGKSMDMVYFENFPPFSWKDNGKMQGILIDVLTEAVEKRMGIPVKHEGYPWARAQLLVKEGQADAFVSVPTPERLEYTFSSKEMVVMSTFTLFAKVGNPKIKDLKNVKRLSDLKRFKLGHYMGSGWAKKNLEGMDVEWAPSLDICLDMLNMGRFDAFIDVSQVIRFNIKKRGLQNQLVEIPTVLDSSSFNLCIGEKSPYTKILYRFDETMRKMKKDGTLQKIYNKYK